MRRWRREGRPTPEQLGLWWYPAGRLQYQTQSLHLPCMPCLPWEVQKGFGKGFVHCLRQLRGLVAKWQQKDKGLNVFCSQVYLKALPATVAHIPNAFPHNLNPLSISKACSFLVGRMHLIPFFSIGMLHLIATPN